MKPVAYKFKNHWYNLLKKDEGLLIRLKVVGIIYSKNKIDEYYIEGVYIQGVKFWYVTSGLYRVSHGVFCH